MRFLLRLLLVVILLALAAAGYSAYSYRTPLSYTGPQTVVAPPGGARALLVTLHEQGLTPRAEVMLLPLLVTGDYKKLKAGEYEFEAGMSPQQIIAKIIRGEVVVHKVTIPEGWNRFQVRTALMAEPLLTGEVPEFAEGSLLPDTMHFARGETRANVIKRMQQAQTELMEKLWPTHLANLPFTTQQEALTLASIVEKETGVADERTMVAGVFVNRLRMGMLLQTDPTVIYGIEVAQGGKEMGRELSHADLERDTAYNTYTRAGLPPTPICNPGRKAIEAVLNPAPTNALYFVATGTGGHNFAATLKEHEKNVVAYRKALREAEQKK